jgi:polyhydroxyalkanoate synthesis regulator phasin
MSTSKSSSSNTPFSWDSWQKKAENLYKRIYANFEGFDDISAHWGEEQEKDLESIEALRERAKKLSKDKKEAEEAYQNIALFSRKARALKEGHGHVNNLKLLYQRVMTGLEQDPKFVRTEEYCTMMNRVGKNIDALQDNSKKVFRAAREFFDDCVNNVQIQQEQAEYYVFRMRLERAEDLLHVCRRSDPSDEREYLTKINALQEVYESYLLPMQKEQMPDELFRYLQLVITNYRLAIASLENFVVE